MATFMKRRNKNGEDRITVVVRVKGYPRQTATFRNMTLARDWAQRTEAAIKDGRHFKDKESKKHTLKELADRFLEELEDSQFKSLPEYKRIFVWWVNKLGDYKLSDVRPALISEYKSRLIKEETHMKKNRSGARANRYLAVLSSAMNTAVKEWGWLEDNPVTKIKKFPEPTGRVRYLDKFEREALIKACENSSNKDLKLVVLMALSTGARKMEIWGLKWNDLDLKTGRIVFRNTKNKEIRGVGLTGPALELLRKKKSNLSRIDTQLLFPSKKNPQKTYNFRSMFEKALKEAQIEDFRWHDLRHTTASYIAMQGASSAEIAAVLGHKSLSMVKRYSHISEDHSTGILEKMNQSIFGN